MPIPKPDKGESEKKYTGRIIPMLIKEGKPPDQAAAIAHDTWRRAKGVPTSAKNSVEVVTNFEHTVTEFEP